MPASSTCAHRRRIRSLAGTVAAVSAIACGTVLVMPAGAAVAASCTAVDISFARGTTEAPGLGLAGSPFVSSLTSKLSGKTVSSYAVDYAADVLQTSAGAGSTDLVNHITQVASACPDTTFVLGGYSQGATVVDKVLGIATFTGGQGTALPAALADRVKAVVVFGNPLGLQGQTIERNSPTYGARAKSYCNTGDPVCGSGFNVLAHLAYGFNGTATDGATFAAGKANA